MDEHAALGLGRHDEQHAEQVGRESRPRSVGHSHDASVDERRYVVAFLLWNVDVVAHTLHLDAQSGEHLRDDAEVFVRHVLDGHVASRHGCHADEAAHLNHVGQDGVLSAVEPFHSLDGEEVGRDAGDFRSHAVEHLAQLLDVRFAGRVVDGGGAWCEHARHDDVGRSGDRCLVEQDVHSVHLVCVNLEASGLNVVVEPGAHLLHAVEVGVEPASSDFVASWLGNERMVVLAEQRTEQQN